MPFSRCCAAANRWVARWGTPWVSGTALKPIKKLWTMKKKSSWAVTRFVFDHYLAQTRRTLNNETFTAEQRRGQALSLAEALAYVQTLPLHADPALANQERLNDLTQREREVVALIGQGKSNSAIADQLVLSKRTVEKHIANILAKLAVTNWARLVLWAVEHGLT
jgi:DNA-binding NarL/FixJ family response regulator